MTSTVTIKPNIVTTGGESVRPDSAGEPSWQQEMRQAIRDPAELLKILELSDTLLPAAQHAAADFGLFAPRQLVAKMRRGDSSDPLLRQVLPLGDELKVVSGFATDAVGDDDATLTPGIIQKYQGRALLIVSGVCAVNCRYCFRRHFPYSAGPRSPGQWDQALATIAADPSIEEVIFSGGDPLTLVDATLAALVEKVAAISHVQRLRIHTRLPVVIPSRVTSDLLAWLTGTRLTPVMVIHANHAAELGEDVSQGLAKLASHGVPLLNQSVLLRGVNDCPATLADLSRRLIQCRVMPYYLHQLDRVAGAAHFEVPTHEGLQIMADLRQRLSGYMVPRYVREVAGGVAKESIE